MEILEDWRHDDASADFRTEMMLRVRYVTGNGQGAHKQRRVTLRDEAQDPQIVASAIGATYRRIG